MRARRTRFQPLLLVGAGLLSIAFLLPPATASGDVRVRTVASGLNNPRGIFLGSGHSFFVAEAGAGGSGPCQPGPFGTTCVGMTGAVTHVTNGSLDRLVRLPSIATTDGSFAFGPHDVAKDEGYGDDGSFFATVGLGGDAAYKAGFGNKGDDLATLVRISRSGNMQVVADLLAYEQAHNPAGGVMGSDPYGILRRGDASIITDAGANDLLKVTDGGRISTLAVFPTRMVHFDGGEVPMDAVPTTVVRGPDGAFSVEQADGVPVPPSRSSRVPGGAGGEADRLGAGIHQHHRHGLPRRVSLRCRDRPQQPCGQRPIGALLRLNPDGSKTVLDRDLSFPTSLAFIPGSDDVLVTNCGICAGGGEVLRIKL